MRKNDKKKLDDVEESQTLTEHYWIYAEKYKKLIKQSLFGNDGNNLILQKD